MIRKRLTVAEAGSNVWEVFDRGKQRNGKHIVESFLNRSDGKTNTSKKLCKNTRRFLEQFHKVYTYKI